MTCRVEADSFECGPMRHRRYGLMRKLSRLLPSASASEIQRGGLPRPDHVAPVSGLRYLGGTGVRAVVAFFAAGRPTRLRRAKASATSSGVISYLRMVPTISRIAGARCFFSRAAACFCSRSISFSILRRCVASLVRVMGFPMLENYCYVCPPNNVIGIKSLYILALCDSIREHFTRY